MKPEIEVKRPTKKQIDAAWEKAIAELQNPENEAESAREKGYKSLKDLSNESQIPESTLKRRIKKLGWEEIQVLSRNGFTNMYRPPI